MKQNQNNQKPNEKEKLAATFYVVAKVDIVLALLMMLDGSKKSLDGAMVFLLLAGIFIVISVFIDHLGGKNGRGQDRR